MTRHSLDLPALHEDASIASDGHQRAFFWLIRLEFACLLVAGVMALEFEDSGDYYLIYALVLLAGLFVMLFRSLRQPEQSWYRARAAAESIKTSAWRYSMKAHPYNSSSVEEDERELRNYLGTILRTNPVLGRSAIRRRTQPDQITPAMQSLRRGSCTSRKAFYVEHRIRDQETWYRNKSVLNRRMFIFWVIASGSAYVSAAALAVTHVAHPKLHRLPIEPLIVLASSLLTWIQVKRHSELASSYSLTAIEIGLAREAAPLVVSDEDLSDFVNDTELAFSREHTQWIARRQTAG